MKQIVMVKYRFLSLNCKTPCGICEDHLFNLWIFLGGSWCIVYMLFLFLGHFSILKNTTFVVLENASMALIFD